MYKHIVFEGTSIKGLSYCGVIDVLQEEGILESLTHFAGVSSGSVFATMLALGYTSQEVKEFLTIERMAGIIPDHYKVYLLYSLMRRMGFYSQKYVRKELVKLIELKYPATLTFGELYSQTGHVLVIGVTELISHTAVYLNPFTNPNVSIVDALTATICLPLFFIPSEYNFTGESKVYIDGGVANDFPIWIFNDMDLLATGGIKRLRECSEMSPYTLGIGATDNVYQTHSVSGWFYYTKAIIRTLLFQFEQLTKQCPKQVINVQMNDKMSSFDFDLTEEERQYLIQRGRETALVFLQAVQSNDHKDNNVDE